MTKKRKKIVINIDEWDLGNWPYDLSEAVDVEVDKSVNEITITLKWGDACEKAVKKIAKEAIEAEYESISEYARLTSGGIEIPDSDSDKTIIYLKWDNIFLGYGQELDKTIKAFETRMAEIKKEEELQDD